MISPPENLSLLPETSVPKEHFKLVFGSGNSDLGSLGPLKNWDPRHYLGVTSPLYENFHKKKLGHGAPIAAGAPLLVPSGLSYYPTTNWKHLSVLSG